MREKLLHRINQDLRSTSMPKLAKRIGIKYDTLYRILTGSRGGTFATWETIVEHYEKERRKNAKILSGRPGR